MIHKYFTTMMISLSVDPRLMNWECQRLKVWSTMVTIWILHLF